MIYETRKYVDVLINLQITPNQFLLAWLLYNKQWDELKDYLEFRSFDMSEITDMIDKDIVLNLAGKNSNQIQASDLVVTERFAHEMIVDPDEAWDEFFKKYPGKLLLNGVPFAAKGLKLSEEKELKERYTKEVNRNKYLHAKILALLEEHVKKNGGLAVMKIDKFITGQYWNEIETERDNNRVGPALF